MTNRIQLLDLNDTHGQLVQPTWLNKSEAVHRELRPHLPADYERYMANVFRGGARMTIAVRDDVVVGVAVHRVYQNTADGRMMYVDDLVTQASARSSGVGKALMDHLQALARSEGCDRFKLDSGTHREQAHKFYFREGMTIIAFHFKKALR
jgi:GNAT superfamily N-acetyltransferase